MDKFKSSLMIAVCVALASQFQFSLFVPGFIITLSVIVFAVLLYHHPDINPMLIAGFTALISPLFRGVMLLGEHGLQGAWSMVAPDVAFYLAYGVFFYKLFYKSLNRDLGRFAIAIFWCDFLSNMVEMGIRTKVFGITAEMVQMLLIFAFCRTLITLGILTVIRYYKSFLVKEEHELRYRNLMMLTSKFKSEIYFMHKNMAEIEDVMKKAFEVYRTVSGGDYPEHLKALTLDIAKDVHEIKKEYIGVIKGLEEISRDRIDVSVMSIKDIMLLLEMEAKEMARQKSLDAEILFRVDADFQVKEHFYLVSVLKNLMTNALESMDLSKKGSLALRVFEKGDTVEFCCQDNGRGIKEDNAPFIFNPGFSTKFDHKTGNIGRGIGLTLVKDIVADKFGGKVEISSIEGSGATFVVKIPSEAFREA